jgi:hypothetical protein
MMKLKYIKLIFPHLCGFICVILSPIVFAQTNNLVDHPLIQGFPDSEINETEFGEDVNYRVVLGSLQRTRGLVVPEDSERLRGDVTKLTYEISPEFTGNDVYQFFLEQAAEKSYSELFACTGSACGSSNYWANDIFRKRILYGPERNQFYLVMQSSTEVGPLSYISLYIITRGNRRTYAHIEIIEVGGSLTPRNTINVSDLSATLLNDGGLILAGIEFREDDRLSSSTDLAFLVELLQNNSSRQFYLVSHVQGEEFLSDLMRRSTMRANEVARRLIGMGVSASQIIAEGVGPLAPRCGGGNCEEFIELVLR